jgi:putative transposase
MPAARALSTCFSHAVWLSCRFCLSYRDVAERRFVRGVLVSHAAMRQWCHQCGQAYAKQLRRRRPTPGDNWPLDAVCLTSNGQRHSLWRVVDQEGNGWALLGQRRRDKQAAQQCFRKLLTGLTSVPRGIITDTLQSAGAAQRELLPGVEHRQQRSLNHRAANSPQPTRQRERRMQGFKSAGHAQRFLAAYGPIAQHFRPRRHRFAASAYRQEMGQRFHSWQDIVRLPTAA